MSQVFLCPLCRRDLPNRSRAWPLQARGPILRCTNPGCDGRFAADPFPIIHAAPGIAFERMIQPPAAVPLEALGMMLRSLPPDSHLLHALEQRSKHLWAQFHDLLPDRARGLELRLVGDAMAPRRASDAIREGEIAAREI